MAKKLGGNRRGSQRNKVAKKITPQSEQLHTGDILLNSPLARGEEKKRGRSSAISDTELGFRRLEMQSKLEEHWGEVAWACMHSRTPEDIRKAFAIFGHSNTTPGRLVECITRASFENVTSTDVARTRKEYWQVRRNIHPLAERRNVLMQKEEQLNRAKTELLNPPPSNPPSPREAAKNLRYVNDEIAKHLESSSKDGPFLAALGGGKYTTARLQSQGLSNVGRTIPTTHCARNNSRYFWADARGTLWKLATLLKPA